MLQGAQSIQAGRISPSTILRKLGSASRKNKLYYAFRELGRVTPYRVPIVILIIATVLAY
jgi:TnpA family transposase